MSQDTHFDVVVVGAGNAGLCAAQSALENGATVAVLEKAPREERGGNSALTGHMRFPYDSVEQLVPLIDDVDPDEIEAIRQKLPSRTQAQLRKEILNTTAGLADPDLLETHVTQAYDTILWLRGRGHAWVPNLAPTAGNTMQMKGRGYALQERHFTNVENEGGHIFYGTSMTRILTDDDGRVTGIEAIGPEGKVTFTAGAVVLTCGGFEANPEMRARYLGAGWDAIKNRGVPYNTGDGLRAALEIGAMSFGGFNSAHASPQDIDRPKYTLPSSVPKGGTRTSRYAYPYSIMVNRDGTRFVDEGSDVRGRTYAKMGRSILAQPGNAAYQVFDKKARDLGLLEDYDRNAATGVNANTLEELADMIGVSAKTLVATVEEYNAAIQPEGTLDPNPFYIDGKGTKGLSPEKSNYAIEISEAPFEAYGVTCAITFTFGGLKVDPHTAQVVHTSGRPIPGLYTAGEMLGGLWHWNYPSGSGMMAGAVFGRIAGREAANATVAAR